MKIILVCWLGKTVKTSTFALTGAHSVLLFENRRCAYCQVPDSYNVETELTVDESKQVIDRMRKWGFHILSIIGGEPLADAANKEGISYREHTLQVASHAAEKGMFVSITSNGDYLNEILLEMMAEAGVRSLILSLHSQKKLLLTAWSRRQLLLERGVSFHAYFVFSPNPMPSLC